jgi:hypothetical protein
LNIALKLLILVYPEMSLQMRLTKLVCMVLKNLGPCIHTILLEQPPSIVKWAELIRNDCIWALWSEM